MATRAHTPTRAELLALQRLLLPETLPSVGCTEVAAAYRAHNEALKVGADWYDLIDRRDNKVVAIVGDVVGHGVEQIGVMGQLRAASNALARICTGPLDLLANLDDVASDLPGAAVTTVAVLMLDGSTTARLALAGHPPLIHVSAAGHVRFVSAGHRAPLTIGSASPSDESFEYGIDDLLILCTDGLIERRGVPLEAGLAGVGDYVAQRRTESCLAIATGLVDDFADDSGDDVALMVLRPRNHRHPDYVLQRTVPSNVLVRMR